MTGLGDCDIIAIIIKDSLKVSDMDVFVFLQHI